MSTNGAKLLTAQTSQVPSLTVSYPCKPPYNAVQNPNNMLSCVCTNNLPTYYFEADVITPVICLLCIYIFYLHLLHLLYLLPFSTLSISPPRHLHLFHLLDIFPISYPLHALHAIFLLPPPHPSTLNPPPSALHPRLVNIAVGVGAAAAALLEEAVAGTVAAAEAVMVGEVGATETVVVMGAGGGAAGAGLAVGGAGGGLRTRAMRR